MQTKPKTPRNRIAVVQVPKEKLVVKVIMSFSIARVSDSENIFTRQLQADFDSENQGKDAGFSSVISSFMGGNESQATVDDAANILVDKCVQQFVRLISPNEEKIAVKLEKGKSKAVASGNKMAEAHDYAGALEKYQQALSEKSDDAGAAYNAGVMCELLGDNAQADKYYTQAMELGDKPVYIEARARLRKNMNFAPAGTAAPATEQPSAEPQPKSPKSNTTEVIE